MPQSDNLRPQWRKVADRLQHEARKQAGYAVIKITVLVDANGNPVLWTEPDMRRIEPKADCVTLPALLDMLGMG